MSTLRIRVRVGPDYSRGGTRTGGYSSTDNKASQIFDAVARHALGKASRVGTERVLKVLPKVQEDIYADIDRFAQGAMKFMFSRKSPRNGGDLRFSLSSPLADGRGSITPFVSASRSISASRALMSWPALSKSMLQKKRPNTTYFVFTGKLKWELDDEGVFASFMRDVLKPGIKYETVEEEQAVTKKIRKIGRLSVFVAASKKGQNLANMPFLASGAVSPGADQSLISRYLGDEIAVKLTNARYPEKKRPFVTPLLGYWVLQRFPYVVASSLERHLKRRIKADGTEDSYSVGGP